MTQTAQVPDQRAHWELRDGRPACLVEGLPLVDAEVADLDAPSCGACVAVLAFLGFDPDDVWRGWTLPVERPSQALAALRGTPWAQMFSTDSPAGEDTWWFETEEEDR